MDDRANSGLDPGAIYEHEPSPKRRHDGVSLRLTEAMSTSFTQAVLHTQKGLSAKISMAGQVGTWWQPLSTWRGDLEGNALRGSRRNESAGSEDFSPGMAHINQSQDHLGRTAGHVRNLEGPAKW